MFLFNISYKISLSLSLSLSPHNKFSYDTGAHLGIAELLEILASIINGFAVPIKDEHKEMLKDALIPLHKSANLMEYHPQLAYCMNLYATKDADIVGSVSNLFIYLNVISV